MGGQFGVIKVQHTFKKSLELSHEQSDAPWWERVYRSAFPTMHSMMCVRNDGWAQRGGIDRVVTLNSGKAIYVDEKVRDKAWPDILLEYWSSEEHKRPGWIAQDMASDYIAYAFIPTEECYLLPFHTLRLAWHKNRGEWVAKYRRIEAANQGYTTVSVAVPIAVVLDSLSDAVRVSWSDAA